MASLQRIDPVSSAHHGLVAALAESCFDPALGDGWGGADVIAFLDQPYIRAWLALAGDAANPQPAGFALCRLLLEEAELLLVGVRPDYRRQGVGTALLAAVRQAARAAGINRLHLEVRADNDAALSLYRVAGFAICGRRPGYYQSGQGAPRDALTLVCHLQDGRH